MVYNYTSPYILNQGTAVRARLSAALSPPNLLLLFSHHLLLNISIIESAGYTDSITVTRDGDKYIEMHLKVYPVQKHL